MTNLHSAGFVRICSKGGKTVISCWGSSYTLGIETKDGDDKLIAETLSIR